MPPPQGESPPPERLSKASPLLQWTLVLGVSVVFFAVLDVARLPAAALIGPMLAAAAAGINGATVRVATWLFAAAQAVVGVLVAGSIEPGVLRAFAADWPVFVAGVLSTLAASSYLGWQISRWKILPGTTAIWGSSPGAATAMVLMAEAFGADFRLVAFMQYLRVMIVALAAAVIATLFAPEADGSASLQAMFPPLEWPTIAVTLAVVAAGALCGRLLRIPSPYFLGAMILGGALHLGFDVAFQLPPWLLTAAYAVIGWSIGLSFTRPILRHAARALPQVVGSILVLLLFCAGISFLMSRVLGIDFLTAYLATSPGGLDAVAIIAAASSNVNMSFVLAMQMARFLFVLLSAPLIARLLARIVPS